MPPMPSVSFPQQICDPPSLFPNQQGAGMSWLFPFVDGHPPIGWANAGAYLAMPILLILSQYATMKLVSPPQV